MKKTCTRLFCLFAVTLGAFTAHAQSFLKIIDNGGDDYGNVITAADGSNAAIVGSTSKAGAGSYDIMLTKVDSAGNPLWEKQYGGQGFDAGRYIMRTSDNGFLLVGSSTSFNSSSQALVIKTDNNGTVQWAKTFGTDSVDYGFRAAEGDNGYLIAGQTSGAPVPNNTKSDMLLIKLDYSGNVVWSKSLGSQAGHELPRDVFFAGEVWVVAGSSSAGLVGGVDGVFFVLDTAGALLADFLAGGTADDDFRNIVPGNNSVYMVGATRSYGVSGDDISITKYSITNGPPVHQWVKSYGTTGDESVTSAKVIPDGSGNILVAGLTTSGGSGTGQEGFLMLVDSNGTLLLAKRYGSTGDDIIMDVAFSNQGALAIGYTNSFPGTQNDVMVMRLDNTGSIPCNTASITFTSVTQQDSALGPFIADYITMDMALDTATVNVTVNSYAQTLNTVCTNEPSAIVEVSAGIGFDLFPNPANDNLNVVIYSNDNAAGRLSICNYLGQEVMVLNTGFVSGKNNFQFTLNNLSTGMYFLKIATAQGQSAKAFTVN